VEYLTHSEFMCEGISMKRAALQSKLWIPLGVFMLLAGITHFANPVFFDDIVPPWLPPSERFWTYISGLAEIAIGAAVLMPKYRKIGALASVALFIAVYPANMFMVWDWRDRSTAEQAVSWVRLPFQFVFIWMALIVAKQNGSPIAGNILRFQKRK
jgi:uncharacterized membrane protein